MEQGPKKSASSGEKCSRGHAWDVVNEYEADDAELMWPEIKSAAAVDHAYIQSMEIFVGQMRDYIQIQFGPAAAAKFKDQFDGMRNNYRTTFSK